MKDVELKNCLFDIISKYAGVQKKYLTLDSEILYDLGIAGDDAFAMIEEICIKFDINCQNFCPADVCEQEGGDFRTILLNPFYLYRYFFHKKSVSFPSFTIRTLLKAMESKYLESVKPEGYYYAKEVIT
jgi:hypothetical protein